MKARGLLTGLLVIVCLATLWSVRGQRSELASLRAEQQQWAAQVAARGEQTQPAVAAESGGAAPAIAPATPAAPPELLRLRAQVTRLTERRQDLAGVRAENARLRAQVTSRATNGLAASQPPPGYIRKSDAKMVGFKTPEDTLQTLLWASRNHDATTVLQAFAPERAEQLQQQLAAAKAAGEDLFTVQPTPPGLRVLGRKQDPEDGSLSLKVEMLPGMPPETIKFMQTNGQWKITED